MPRQHQQQIFVQLQELFSGVAPSALNLDAIVYGRGPGSFTGLRIAVSATQGLAYSLGIPVVGISSLETQVHTLLRQASITHPAVFLSSIDARIGQVYAQWFAFDGEAVQSLGAACIAPAEAIEPPAAGSYAADVPIYGVGSGIALAEQMPNAAFCVQEAWPEVLPEAVDMFTPAQAVLAAGDGEDPMQAAPDYVQQRIGWKTLAEQGRTA